MGQQQKEAAALDKKYNKCLQARTKKAWDPMQLGPLETASIDVGGLVLGAVGAAKIVQRQMSKKLKAAKKEKERSRRVQDVLKKALRKEVKNEKDARVALEAAVTRAEGQLKKTREALEAAVTRAKEAEAAEQARVDAERTAADAVTRANTAVRERDAALRAAEAARIQAETAREEARVAEAALEQAELDKAVKVRELSNMKEQVNSLKKRMADANDTIRSMR